MQCQNYFWQLLSSTQSAVLTCVFYMCQKKTRNHTEYNIHKPSNTITCTIMSPKPAAHRNDILQVLIVSKLRSGHNMTRHVTAGSCAGPEQTDGGDWGGIVVAARPWPELRPGSLRGKLAFHWLVISLIVNIWTSNKEGLVNMCQEFVNPRTQCVHFSIIIVGLIEEN